MQDRVLKSQQVGLSDHRNAYTHRTLVGNWNEEKYQQEQESVLHSLDYTTTSRESFQDHSGAARPAEVRNPERPSNYFLDFGHGHQLVTTNHKHYGGPGGPRQTLASAARPSSSDRFALTSGELGRGCYDVAPAATGTKKKWGSFTRSVNADHRKVGLRQ